jgi:chemotaxis protein methyltransferase CheR
LTRRADSVELEKFFDVITTNETFFFRTPAAFEWLKNDFVKELVKAKSLGKRSASLRIWSAACSNGDEPYSIAICLAESSVLLRDWKISILGTDISETALSAARAGIYTQRSLQEMDEMRIRRYFTEEQSGKQRLRPNIAQMVQFKNHNLMNRMREPPFDCIFLRNVLIYFDRQSKTKVIDNLVSSLSPGGYLVVGPSEGVYDMLSMFTKRGPFLYQKN